MDRYRATETAARSHVPNRGDLGLTELIDRLRKLTT